MVDSDPLFPIVWLTSRVCVCAAHRLNCVPCEKCMNLAWANSHVEAGQSWPGLENLLSLHTHKHVNKHTPWSSPSTYEQQVFILCTHCSSKCSLCHRPLAYTFSFTLWWLGLLNTEDKCDMHY